MTVDFSHQQVILYSADCPSATSAIDGEIITISGEDYRTTETTEIWNFWLHLCREDAGRLITELEAAVQEADAKQREASHVL